LTSLLRSLLTDAERRYSETLDQWLALEPELPKEAATYAAGVRTRLLERGLNHARRLLADPDLEHPQLAKQFFIEYKRLAELVQLVEENSFLALKRFNLDDRFASALLARICQECGITGDAPLCSATSAQYYFTHLFLNVVFVPCTETTRLLGLSDLFHELGHLQAARHKTVLVDPLLGLVDSEFDDIVRQARQNSWPDPLIRTLESARDRWRGSWLIEFVSDMVATYWVGPAYAWSNVRLCGAMSPDLYGDQNSHPADSARAHGIGVILRRLAFNTEADEIDRQWLELIQLAGDTEPATYKLSYPQHLIDRFAQATVAACRTLGLVPYGNPIASNRTVAALLNEAWTRFRNDPAGYPAWEHAEFDALRQQVGI
jgi:hypothetical protein